MQDQRSDIEWRDGSVPVSKRFDDPYYSLEDGLEETRHVFLKGNDLPRRFRDGFHIAELGFGTGLNFLTALSEWRASGAKGSLWFTSFEAYPLSMAEMDRALSAFPGLREDAADLVEACAAKKRNIDFGGTAHLEIVHGDARQTVASWNGNADAWFLDGFSPAKNPELWEPDLLAEVARHTRPGGTMATYTAAGHVRRALEAGGFDVERRPGFGRKRHMTVGRMRA